MASTLPISAHRLLACAALFLLLILSLAGTRPTAVPKTAALLTPNIDGSNSLATSVSASGVSDDLFRYRSFIERSQGNQPLVPDNLSDIFHYPMDSVRVRELIVANIAGTSGNLDQALVRYRLLLRPQRPENPGHRERVPGHAQR